jgi:uncharacterized protein (TIGR02246 family)
VIRTLTTTAAALALAATGAFAQANADAAGIAKTRTAFEKAAAAQDAAAIARLFTADGTEMPPNAPASKGRAAIEAYHKAFAQQFMNHGFSLAATDTKANGDTAYEAGTFKQTLMSMKSGGMIEDKGKYLVVLKKDPSAGWLIAYVMYNSDNPMPGQAPAKK